MLKVGLVVFGVTILSFYSVYFFQIVRGRPERFEQMLMQGLALHEDALDQESASPGAIALVIVISLLLEAGYFILALTEIQILAYQIVTLCFVLFEVWHGIKAIPVMRALLHPGEFSEDLFDWRIERTAARLYVVHVLITIGLIIWSGN
ncbi:MAG: hypothetical protein HPY50_09115 [Firmicutes bacterium]|nr:hypothetical protein [Bacillota bacterium]